MAILCLITVFEYGSSASSKKSISSNYLLDINLLTCDSNKPYWVCFYGNTIQRNS